MAARRQHARSAGHSGGSDSYTLLRAVRPSLGTRPVVWMVAAVAQVGKPRSMADGPRVFPFRFDPRYRRAAMLFGITEAHTKITVDPDQLQVRFGAWHVRTPLANITSVAITGTYSFLKTAGPPHLSFSDKGLTFATNGDQGVCLEFAAPITGMDPLGLLKHPNLTLTPADCDGLATALRRHA